MKHHFHPGIVFLAILLIAGLCGCDKLRSSKIPKATPVNFTNPQNSEAPKQPLIIGTIKMVNEEERFVLIESNGYQAPAAGVALKCFRAGVEVGVIAVSAERRREFFTADIVSGNLERGDNVLQ